MRTLLLLIIALLSAAPLHARRVKTGPATLKRPAIAAPADTASLPADTIVPAAGQLTISGFEKDNQSTVETFFATNQLPDSLTVTQIEVELTYTDLDGRMLHRATHPVKCLIPPGETRSLSVRTWDRNHAFHYYRSPAPKRRQSSPFKVRARVLKAAVTP